MTRLYPSRLLILPVVSLLLLSPAHSDAAMTGFPFADEDLNYSVNWPSGLSLGEAHFHSKHAGANWSFDFTIDAGIPGFQVKDVYHSGSTPGFCSVSFNRNSSHGSRKVQEKETVNGAVATRDSSAGTSQISVPDCVKDALTLLYFSRRELGQGRIPNAQETLFGGLYQIRFEYAGEQTIQIGEQPAVSDKVLCTVKGPSSGFTFEMYFARDPARTPLLVKAPLAMGTFSMELIR